MEILSSLKVKDVEENLKVWMDVTSFLETVQELLK